MHLSAKFKKILYMGCRATLNFRKLKKCNKKMGSPCLFTRQRALKMGYFYWLHVKNHLYTELSLGYPKDTKFYLDSKASFIDISSILHLSCFWLLGCRNIALFRTVLCVAWSPDQAKIHPVGDYFPRKKSMFDYQTFFFFKYVLY